MKNQGGTSELQYGEIRWEASDTARNNRRERSRSVGGLHCETHNPCGPCSHEGKPIVGTDQENIHYLDCDLMKRLYTSIVRPHWEYANIVWHPYLKKDIELLERVQHRAAKMVPGLRHLTCEERLRKMDLRTLVYRRAKGDAIDTYKYLNGNYMVDYSQLLQSHQTRGLETKGNGWKLLKKSSRSNLRSNVYWIRIVNL